MPVSCSGRTFRHDRVKFTVSTMVEHGDHQRQPLMAQRPVEATCIEPGGAGDRPRSHARCGVRCIGRIAVQEVSANHRGHRQRNDRRDQNRHRPRSWRSRGTAGPERPPMKITGTKTATRDSVIDMTVKPIAARQATRANGCSPCSIDADDVLDHHDRVVDHRNQPRIVNCHQGEIVESRSQRTHANRRIAQIDNGTVTAAASVAASGA